MGRMKIIKEADSYYLEENGHRILLLNPELKLFRLMQPMDRKAMVRRRAIEKLKVNINDQKLP